MPIARREKQISITRQRCGGSAVAVFGLVSDRERSRGHPEGCDDRDDCRAGCRFLTAPQTFRPAEAGLALVRGAWIGWIVVPYILGGLFFWQLAVKAGSKSAPLERTGDGRANLAGTPGMERAAYRVMLPFAAAAMARLLTATVLLSLRVF